MSTVCLQSACSLLVRLDSMQTAADIDVEESVNSDSFQMTVSEDMTNCLHLRSSIKISLRLRWGTDFEEGVVAAADSSGSC